MKLSKLAVLTFIALASMVRPTAAQVSTPDYFYPGVIGGTVWCTAVQADGKILVGGSLPRWAGRAAQQHWPAQRRRHAGHQLQSGAAIDVIFAGGAGGREDSGGRRFHHAGRAEPRNYIGRLNADGTLDTSFNPGARRLLSYSLAVQADGKILVGGCFTTLGGQTRNYLGRLNADGTLDTGFNPGADGSMCIRLAVQADGKILVGGCFTTLGGQTAQLPWPAQRRRHAGHRLQSGGG